MAYYKNIFNHGDSSAVFAVSRRIFVLFANYY